MGLGIYFNVFNVPSLVNSLLDSFHVIVPHNLRVQVSIPEDLEML